MFAVVAPIGANIDDTVKALSDELKTLNYRTTVIKVTEIFRALAEHLPGFEPLQENKLEARYNSYITFGDQLRRHFDDDSILAACCIPRIIEQRTRLSDREQSPQRTAYILHQFKRQEETELLRTIYGKQFFQISVNSKRSSRVDNLAQKIASSHNSASSNLYREVAEQLVQRDEHEVANEHGQRVSDVFHQADFIVNTDIAKPDPKEQVKRFVELIFGENSISPTKSEYGLYAAKSASLRSVDLSRQVGAAIFTQDGEIISLGANEVPKAKGGTYWCDDPNDNRDFRRQEDSNDRRKRELLAELALLIDEDITFLN